jgi:hypothetical protein
MTDHSNEPARSVNKIFGDVLPDTTADEREHGPSDTGGHHDDWLLENRPPHHG